MIILSRYNSCYHLFIWFWTQNERKTYSRFMLFYLLTTKKCFYFSVTYFVKKFNLYVVYFIWRYTIWIKYDQSYIVMLLPIWTLLRRYLLNDYMVIYALVTLWYHANYRLCIIDYHLCSQVVLFDIWLIFCSAGNI